MHGQWTGRARTASFVWMLSQGGLPGGEGKRTLGFRMAETKRFPVREPGLLVFSWPQGLSDSPVFYGRTGTLVGLLSLDSD